MGNEIKKQAYIAIVTAMLLTTTAVVAVVTPEAAVEKAWTDAIF